MSAPTTEPPTDERLSRRELEQQPAERLPDREGTFNQLRNDASAEKAGEPEAATKQGGPMTDETRRPEEAEEKEGLSPEELEAQDGEKLPDREAMSLVDANVAVPVNAAVAANVLSDNATATADADQ